MERSKNIIIIAALDITRQLFTWDNKLQKDVFTRYLDNFIDQTKVISEEKIEVLGLIENILYAVNDERPSVELKDYTNDINNALSRIYNAKTHKISKSPREEINQQLKKQESETEIAEELLQLKIRLHGEIMSVKNDIQMCKQYINKQVNKKDNNTTPRQLMSQQPIEDIINEQPELKKRTFSKSPRIYNALPRIRNGNSLIPNPPEHSNVKRRGSQTNLYDEINTPLENRTRVNILLGDSIFHQIESKRLISDSSGQMITYCEEILTMEKGFSTLIYYIDNNPTIYVTSVSIMLGRNDLEKRTCSPTDLALTMINYIRDLLKKIDGSIFLYTLPPRLDDSNLDRKTSHFNNQLIAIISHSHLDRVMLIQDVITRDMNYFQKNSFILAGPGVNKLMRVLRRNLLENTCN